MSDISSSAHSEESNTTPPTVPEKSPAERLKTITDHTGVQFFMARQDHIRYLQGDGSAAVVLAFIINTIRMYSQSERGRQRLFRQGLWIRCPAKGIQRSLGMKEGRQRTAIKRLVQAKLIQTKRKGGNVLWVQTVEETLEKVRKEWENWKKEKDAVWEALQKSIAAHRAMPYGEYLKTEHWQKTRDIALKISGNKCRLCSAKNIVLDVHHNTYERLGHERQEDLIVLCRSCHEKFHNIVKEGGVS